MTLKSKIIDFVNKHKFAIGFIAGASAALYGIKFVSDYIIDKSTNNVDDVVSYIKVYEDVPR